MNPLDWLYTFATDAKKKISHRMIFILLLIFVVIFVDDTLAFSYNYRVSYKIQELKEVNDIIENKLTDSITRLYAINLREDIFKRKSIVDYLSFRSASLSSKNAHASNPAHNPNTTLSIRNEFLFTLSSGGFFILSAFLVFVAILTDRELNFFDRFLIGLGMFCTMGGFGIMLSSLLEYIPLIGGNWHYNYLINFTIQAIIIFLFSVSYSYFRTIEFRKSRHSQSDILQ